MSKIGVLTGAVVVIGAVVFVLQRGPEKREEQALAELAVAVEPDLTAVLLTTERFRDVEVALAEGYPGSVQSLDY